jgi:hypothetical protein
VPIWIDEIADVEAWKSEFMKPEAKEVVEAVGAWVYCFRTPRDCAQKQAIEETMKAIFEVSEEHMEYTANSLMLAVAMPRSAASVGQPGVEQDEWEDMCLKYGFEYIDSSARGVNDFGENLGFERLKEALEANEWEDTGLTDEELDFHDLGLEEGGSNDFSRDEAEMTAEIFGVKAALAADDLDTEEGEYMPPNQQENQVEDLDRLMGKLMAVKENSVGLPEDQRRRMAAKAVSELMKDSTL